MDSDFAQHHQIPLQAQTHQLPIHLADGSHLKSGPITQETCLLLAISDTGHQEYLHLNIIPFPLFPVILGIPWLQAHNPQINWGSRDVTLL